MRAVVQRVKQSSVTTGGNMIGQINAGLLILLGIGQGDDIEDINYLVDKIINLRIFSDGEGQMNLSAVEEKKELLVVPQFTLYGDCRQGRRPSFSSAASPGEARKLYHKFVDKIKQSGLKVETGKFQAVMDVKLINDGPVTMLLDSNREF